MDLIRAVKNNDVPEIIELLGNGADVNYVEEDDEESPLLVAVDKLNYYVAELLLLNGADPNIESIIFTPLIIAAAKNSIEMVNLLLKYGADVNVVPSTENTPLIEASERSNLEMARIFVDCGIDVNASDFEGNTAINVATSRRDLEMVQYLHKSGASLYEDNGHSIIYAAANNVAHEVIEYLLDLGLDPNEVDDRGFTPIMQAVVSNDVESIKILQERGGNIHMYDGQNGKSNLIMAAERDYYETVEYLLQQRSDATHEDKAGYSALMYASENGYDDVVKLLLQRGNDYGHYTQAYNLATNETIRDMIKPRMGSTIKSATRRYI